jgi:hypothetical protein
MHKALGSIQHRKRKGRKEGREGGKERRRGGRE